MSEQEMNDLIEKMHRVEALMHRSQMAGMRAFGPHTNPHRGQGRVLALLQLQPETTQKDLAYLLDMRQQSVSELLAKLEQKGYITRTPSPEDKRTTLIRLTDEGRAAAQQDDPAEGGLASVFATLSLEEQRQFGSYLDRLAEALEKYMEGLGADWKAQGPRGQKGRCGPMPHHGPGHGFGAMHGGFGRRRGPGPEGSAGFPGPEGPAGPETPED